MSVIARTRILVTPEMLDAMQAAVPLAITNEELSAIYRAGRSVEPGVADPGVMQQEGVSPYGAKR